eukprot:4807289-Amphidinium_carterae.1
MPNDNQTMNLQQQTSSQPATTMVLPQANQSQPSSVTIYEQPRSHVYAFTDGAKLVVDKDNTTTDQLQRWAILIDTGAITS